MVNEPSVFEPLSSTVFRVDVYHYQIHYNIHKELVTSTEDFGVLAKAKIAILIVPERHTIVATL